MTAKSEYTRQLERQNLFTKTGAIVGQLTFPAAATAAAFYFAAPLLALMPSTLLALGALLTVLALSMVIGNLIGRFTGMIVDYATRPDTPTV
jgi:hypothetical protein